MTEHGRLTATQWAALQEAIDGKCVERREEDDVELSYISHWYVRAKLLNIFGYCNYDVETLSLKETIVQKFEDGRAYFLHTAQVRLHIKDQEGRPLAFYDDTACGEAWGNMHIVQGPKMPGKACHRSATTALSLALVRCTNNLGDPFGLSLYNKGSLEPVVQPPIITPPGMIPPQREDEDELLQQATSADYIEDPEETP